MTVKQFALRAKISLSLAYAAIAEGHVRHRRASGRGKCGAKRIAEAVLQAFLATAKSGEGLSV
jgi:hypothetical protein